jgi:uncharacterized protein
MRVTAMFRYSVKGFSPEPQSSAALEAGHHWPGDRLFAVENGPSGFDAANPRHQPKIKYLMLMRNESLARLSTRYEDTTHVLSICHEGREVACGDLQNAEGRARIEAWLAGFCASDLRGAPKLLAASHHYRFTDSRSGFVSLINLASVAALEQHMGVAINPLRFRGNIHVEGLPAHAELDWLPGTRIAGSCGVVLEVVKRIERCAATNVDPATGMRDMQIPKALMTSLGHVDCGVYLRIAGGGTLVSGAHLSVVADQPSTEMPFG